MKTTKKITLLLSLIIIIGLTACGGDTGNAQEEENYAVTQVVETAMAAITQTAAVQSPTPNHTPTFTPAPTSTSEPTATFGPTPTLPAIPTKTSSFQQPQSETSTCDIGEFIKDVTIPDGTQMSVGTQFTKTWKIENVGTCTWNKNYLIVYYGGTQLANDVMFRFTDEDIEPGETVEISIDMTAPDKAGVYTNYWILKNDVGQIFYVDGSSIYVEIAVGITPTPTNTPEPNDSPEIVIDEPIDGYIEDEGVEITFTGTATDPEDGDLSSSIEWRSSIDGLLGTAKSINISTLSVGTHTITAIVKDTGGELDEDTIIITINDTP